MKKHLAIISVIACLLIGVRLIAAAEKVVGGPFVIGVTGKTATIAWLVQGDQVSLRGNSGAAITSPALRVETTTMTSLQPNTRYEYSIESMGEAGKGSFKTPPAGAEPFRFVVYGDNRSRHDVHRRVIAQVLKLGAPDFIMQTGDMVENGNESAQWPIFFEVEKDLLRQTAFFATLGNHERNTHYFGDIFHNNAYYSFDWGNAHFSIIDSDIANFPGHEREQAAFWSEETRWLEQDLSAHQKADFRFVMMHHPPFTAVASRQGTNGHVATLTPTLEKYGVSAGFFGHDHNYQHHLKNGIHYVTTGGGGAPLYDVSKPAAGVMVKAASIENFVSVSVNGKAAHFQAIDINGSTIEDFQIQAP